ncbi:MAG: phosphogluconate dehydrogenase (NAD(+)-dependent, decarboxylating) [Betaproteobacteria bacterium]
MEIGMIGLGRMGGNMTERLAAGGHRVVGFDPSAEARTRASTHATTVGSLPELAEKLAAPRVAWLMVPAGIPVDDAISALLTRLAAGDTLVDGGNSFYRDTQRRARELAERGIDFVDVGTSGGIWGREKGYCMMAGGAQRAVERLHPVLRTLAPAPDKGWAHVGPSGAGHFVKMVHNGIEYGLMQAYAEGFALMQRKSEFALDLQAIAETWREGSVIRSWLLDLTASALHANPELEGIAPYVPDSGEGRWTVAEAIALDVPAPVITLALLERLRSRERNSYADRLLAALRHAFGGHAVKTHS